MQFDATPPTNDSYSLDGSRLFRGSDPGARGKIGSPFVVQNRVPWAIFQGATGARDVESTRLSDLVLGSNPIGSTKTQANKHVKHLLPY
jgi:hypothetical protein